MIKVYSLLPRKPAITVADFHEHWQTVHAEHAKRISTLHKYVQSHRIPAKLPSIRPARYEGIAEIWVEDLPTLLAQRRDPDYTSYAQPDEPNFIDMSHFTAVVTCDEHVHRMGATVGRDIKLMLMLRARPDVGPSFGQQWLDTAEETLTVFHSASSVAATAALPEAPSGTTGDAAYQGFAELRWQDLSELRAAWDDALRVQFLSQLGELVDWDHSASFIAYEKPILPAPS